MRKTEALTYLLSEIVNQIEHFFMIGEKRKKERYRGSETSVMRPREIKTVKTLTEESSKKNVLVSMN